MIITLEDIFREVVQRCPTHVTTVRSDARHAQVIIEYVGAPAIFDFGVITFNPEGMHEGIAHFLARVDAAATE